jgi:membrane-bound metal-dependent hydrolase YbcI (DUF457 family)
MFIGHFALAFASKRINRKPSLGTYFLAAQFIDLLWPLFLVLGIEKVEVEAGNTAFTPLNFISYPYSHSLLGVIVWSLLFAAVYYLVKRDRKAAIVLACIVFSHWILDLLMHRPDLPLSPWTEAKYGLGLWNNKAATLLLEVTLFLLGTYIYLISTEAKNGVGKYALWTLVIFLLLVYLMNAFGPPPESAEFIGVVGFSQWLIIAWGYWIDHNRRAQPVDESRLLMHHIE